MSYNPPVKAEPSSAPIPPPRARPPPPASRFPSQKPKPTPTPSSYSDFRLVSTGTGGYKFNVLKFNTPKPIDPRTLPPPVLLNRKDPRNAGRAPPPPPDPNQLSTEVGADGKLIPLSELKPVLDIHGKPMLGPDGKVMYATGKRGPGADLSLIAPGGGAVKNKKNLFKKKTKQVHKVEQDRMRLRREERYPWVLESGVASSSTSSTAAEGSVKPEPGGSEPAAGEATQDKEIDVWVGRMEDTANQNYVLFVFEDDSDAFQVVDVRRWYKFQQRPAYNTLDMDQAEELYARAGKGKETGRWMMHDSSRQPPSSAASSNPSSSGFNSPAPGAGASRRLIVKQEATPGWLRRSTAASAAAASSSSGGERVKKEALMDWEDDEEGAGRRRGEGGDGAAGGDGDFDYEDEFSDDDGQLEFDPQDENEAKELEDRLKKEFRAANAVEGENVAEEEADSDDDLFGDGKPKLHANGKAIKKVLKKNDKGDTYASDDDNENPYASESESESDEEPPKPADETPKQGAPVSTSDGILIPPPPPSRKPSTQHQQPSRSASRPASPGAGGSALLAQRATSPHRNHHQRNHSSSSSRAGSLSREPSPAGSSLGRAASREASPSAGAGANNKRKGTPEAGDGGKKARLEEPAPAGAPAGTPADGNALPAKKTGGPSEAVIIKYIREHSPDIPSLVKHFKRSLKSTDPAQTAANKAALIEVIKKVANPAGGVITLKEAYA